MQPAETTLQLVGKTPRRFAKRVSAGDLSSRIRERIADLMVFHECSDRAAEAAQKEFPSFRITGKTVSDIMLLRIARKPPATELSLAASRRSA